MSLHCADVRLTITGCGSRPGGELLEKVEIVGPFRGLPDQFIDLVGVFAFVGDDRNPPREIPQVSPPLQLTRLRC